MKETQDKGITLIALVVIIIVLIILAGVSIKLVLDDNGIIIKAKEASQEPEISGITEKIKLDIAAKEIEKTKNNSKFTKSEMEEILQKYGTINYEGTAIKSITTTEGNYEILYEDIYTGKLEVVTKVVKASDIEADVSYIGKYVNYGGQENYKGVKWRIFNAENGKIQLIADNYIKSDVMPTATNIRKGTAEGANSDYCVYSANNRVTLLNYINTISNWSDFVAVTGATVTGAPTLEQFINSYNRTHRESSKETVKEIFIAKETAMSDGLDGYYVGKSKNPTTTYISGLDTTEMENLYVIDDDTNANGYWTASPSAFYPTFVVFVQYNGELYYNGYGNRYMALRPLVSLPSGITLVEQENKTYNIKQDV